MIFLHVSSSVQNCIIKPSIFEIAMTRPFYSFIYLFGGGGKGGGGVSSVKYIKNHQDDHQLTTYVLICHDSIRMFLLCISFTWVTSIHAIDEWETYFSPLKYLHLVFCWIIWCEWCPFYTYGCILEKELRFFSYLPNPWTTKLWFMTLSFTQKITFYHSMHLLFVLMIFLLK